MPAAETVTTDPIAKVVSSASNASRLDEKLNWGSCGVETNQLPTFVSFDGNNANAPMDIVADSAELSRETNENIFLGKVEHTQGSQQIFAEAMRYNQETGQMDAQGDVLMITPDMRMSAPRVSYNTKTRSGDATDVTYRMPGILGRGTSESTNIIDDLHSEHNTVTYTTCAPGDKVLVICMLTNSSWIKRKA
jgi:lipopolysaccharide assembly outer membrane protein LptD (OstA)